MAKVPELIGSEHGFIFAVEVRLLADGDVKAAAATIVEGGFPRIDFERCLQGDVLRRYGVPAVVKRMWAKLDAIALKVENAKKGPVS